MLEMTHMSNHGRCFGDSEVTDEALTLLTEVFPDRAHLIEMVEYFTKGLEDSRADLKPSERGYRTCKT